MSNQNPFSRRKQKQLNKENKQKEEEEMSVDNNFTCEIMQANFYPSLNFVIDGMKIKNTPIERYSINLL